MCMDLHNKNLRAKMMVLVVDGRVQKRRPRNSQRGTHFPEEFQWLFRSAASSFARAFMNRMITSR